MELDPPSNFPRGIGICLLEVFSSVCIESVYFKKPIVVSDKGFNREILGEYALYCDSFSSYDCSKKIIQAVDLINKTEYLNEARKYILNKFSFYNIRYNKIKKIFREIIS